MKLTLIKWCPCFSSVQFSTGWMVCSVAAMLAELGLVSRTGRTTSGAAGWWSGMLVTLALNFKESFSRALQLEFIVVAILALLSFFRCGVTDILEEKNINRSMNIRSYIKKKNLDTVFFFSFHFFFLKMIEFLIFLSK